jgi:hypothetical protein
MEKPMNISGIREDSRLLQHWYKTKFTSLKHINNIVQQPLLVIPTNLPLPSEFPTSAFKYYLDTLPKEFNAIYDNHIYIQYKKFNSGQVVVVFTLQHYNYIVTLINSDYYNSKSLIILLFELSTQTNIKSTVVIESFLNEYHYYTDKETGKNELVSNQTGLSETLNTVLGLCAVMAKMAMEADEYPVIVQREKRDTQNITSKKSWKRKDLPRLIFMNAPKTKVVYTNDIKNSLGGTHASPILHRRKGHHRTLRHPKYKNHPKYMVEDGIYIRATWVGDTEYSHEGNRYTVIINDPNKGFDNG